ncbi:MAG: beta-ketoacyl-[acyl-carrier-protein] synthase family protein [Phycisphaerae bacterium]|nr:beta-ketoacyl-[acyl-carrier-protein] synthase family protein [Phycisphaerae bacterium]
MSESRVVITGVGAVSPLGLSTAAMWEGLEAGRTGIGQITAFDAAGLPCPLAGQVPGYRIQDHLPKAHRKAAKLMSRDIELAVLAADQAFRQSGWITRGIDPDRVTITPERTGVNLGAGLISCDLVELAPAVAASTADGRFDIRRWGTEGMPLVTPLWLLKYLPNMLSCHVSIIHDLQGPSNCITCGEASGHLAIAEAKQTLDRGDADVSLAGGAEAKVSPMVLLTQCLLGRTARPGPGGPDAAYRPFDAEATGSVFGDGAGAVVLETTEQAGRRGAAVLAEVAGVGQSCSLSPAYRSLEPDGRGVQTAIQQALDEAGIGSEDLDLIVPHGTGVPEDDLAEAKGIEAALGPALDSVPVWPTKAQISNTGAGAGALDVVATVCAMRKGLIPAAKNCVRRADGCRLRIVTEAIRAPIRWALCCSYTYGGQTTAILLRNPDHE